jgi:hypothetical protein
MTGTKISKESRGKEQPLFFRKEKRGLFYARSGKFESKQPAYHPSVRYW